MDLRQNHATTLIGASGVHLPIIFVLVPVRQVFTDLGADANNVAKVTFVQQRLESLQAGVKTEVVANVKQQLLLRHQSQQFFDPVQVTGEWLLHEHRNASLGTSQLRSGS